MSSLVPTSKHSKPSDTGDLILGSVGRLMPTSPFLDRLTRYLSTYAGSDKALTVIQYTLKLLIPFLEWRARLQHHHGKRPQPVSPASGRLAKLVGLIGESQMLWRLLGILPIMGWAASIEKNPPTKRRLLMIERLQALSMLVYFPLDNMYFFGKNGIYPMPPTRMLSLALWSTRAWAAYVALQFLHLREDVAILEERGRRLRVMKREYTEKKDLVVPEGPSDADVAKEYAAIKKKKTTLTVDFIANLAWFTQAVHWSLEKGFIGNDIWLSVLGVIANVASLKNGLDAMA